MHEPFPHSIMPATFAPIRLLSGLVMTHGCDWQARTCIPLRSGQLGIAVAPSQAVITQWLCAYRLQQCDWGSCPYQLLAALTRSIFNMHSHASPLTAMNQTGPMHHSSLPLL